MLHKIRPIPFNGDLVSNKKNQDLLISNRQEFCPNCGNTKPTFQHFQNGMLFCFICRKASFPNKNFISAF